MADFGHLGLFRGGVVRQKYSLQKTLRREFRYYAEMTPCTMQEIKTPVMQKALPSVQKIILRSGFRLGIIVHEGNVYCAYTKHWYFRVLPAKTTAGCVVFFSAGSASGALQHVKQNCHVIAGLTDVSQKATHDTHK